MKYLVEAKGVQYSLNSVEDLIAFIKHNREFTIDPTTLYVFYDYSPHPAGYATERLNFKVIDKGHYLIFPYSKPIDRSLLHSVKDGMIRRYDSCTVKTITKVKSDDEVRQSWLPLLDPHSLVDYSERVEISAARLSHEIAKLEQYKRYRKLYPDVPLYTYKLLCETRMTHIQILREKLKND